MSSFSQGNLNKVINTTVNIYTNWLLNLLHFNNKTKKSSSLQHFSLERILLVVIIPYSDFLASVNSQQNQVWYPDAHHYIMTWFIELVPTQFACTCAKLIFLYSILNAITKPSSANWSTLPSWPSLSQQSRILCTI